MEIYLAQVKILQTVLEGGYFFDSHCIYGTMIKIGFRPRYML